MGISTKTFLIHISGFWNKKDFLHGKPSIQRSFTKRNISIVLEYLLYRRLNPVMLFTSISREIIFLNLGRKNYILSLTNSKPPNPHFCFRVSFLYDYRHCKCMYIISL